MFLCATNALYGPMAEALLVRIDCEHFEPASAGISPEQLHPRTAEVMAEIGIDLSQRNSKRVQELANQSFDFVITLDDATARLTRNFPDAETIHWKFDDLAAVDHEKQLRVFRMVRDQIAQRLHLFVLVQARSQRAA